MDISLIWAMAQNRVIGKDGGLPWRLPNDMRHFMATTMGKPVVMGRKTFQSMQAPLPGRLNIVLTRDQSWSTSSQGVVVVHDLNAAIEVAAEAARANSIGEIMIIGGADIYALALPLATKLYVTYIDMVIAGDVTFPEFDLASWREVSSVDHPKDDKHSAGFVIKTLEKAQETEQV
jgi:dihydrofolate reductase